MKYFNWVIFILFISSCSTYNYSRTKELYSGWYSDNGKEALIPNGYYIVAIDSGLVFTSNNEKIELSGNWMFNDLYFSTSKNDKSPTLTFNSRRDKKYQEKSLKVVVNNLDNYVCFSDYDFSIYGYEYTTTKLKLFRSRNDSTSFILNVYESTFAVVFYYDPKIINYEYSFRLLKSDDKLFLEKFSTKNANTFSK